MPRLHVEQLTTTHTVTPAQWDREPYSVLCGYLHTVGVHVQHTQIKMKLKIFFSSALNHKSYISYLLAMYHGILTPTHFFLALYPQCSGLPYPWFLRKVKGVVVPNSRSLLLLKMRFQVNA